MKIQDDKDYYVKELNSQVCICGRSKKRGRSFCYKCFKSLPRKMQSDLYLTMAEGYPGAFDRAIKWLFG